MNQAKINGNDLFLVYGVGIESGLKNMDRPAEPKPSQEYDWPEMNGKEYVLTGALQDIPVVLNCFIRGNSLEDFFSKKNAFQELLQTPTIKPFWVGSTNQTYNVKYDKISSFDWVSRDINSPLAKFNLELTIVHNDVAQSMVTSNGQKILLSEYYGVGGETEFSITETIGREIISFSRVQPRPVITFGTPSGIQVKHNISTGKFTVPADDPLRAGEYIQILSQGGFATISNGGVISRVANTFDQMQMMMVDDNPDMVIEYTVKADETNSGAVGHYTHHKGKLTQFIEN